MNIKLLYPNALLTAKILPIPEEGYGKGGRRVLKYTKHYYIGSERIASFLGTKQSVGLYCTSETTLIPPMDAKVLEAGDALGDVFAHFDKTFDLDTPYLYGSNSRIICAPAQITQGFGGYWYHPDHLGSSSYITNLHGEISQHMEYLPFGETLVEEHLNSNNSPYKFNAKEFDAETGNYYYGARYYSPKYNLMLSVDPALEMYPGISPYAYTLQNPVRYVDPTGMYVEDHEYSVDKQGNVRKEQHIEGSTSDNLHTKENWDKGVTDKGIEVEDQNILSSLSKDDPNYIANSFWGKKIGAWSKTSNKKDAYSVFKFGSDNTDVEWALEEYSNNRFLIGNNHFSETVGSMTDVAGYDIKDLVRDYHSHLGTSHVDNQASGQMGDQGRASHIIQRLLDQKIDYSKHPKFFIYMPEMKHRFQYSPWNKKFNIKAVKKINDL